MLGKKSQVMCTLRVEQCDFWEVSETVFFINCFVYILICLFFSYDVVLTLCLTLVKGML